MKTTLVKTPRGSFAVREHGEPGVGSGAGLVVCVHGFPDDASTWDRLAEALVEAGHQVAAINLRGHSPSPVDGSLDLDQLALDVLAVVDELSPSTPVHLIGHDYGAQLAYRFLADAPHRFRRAVLLSGAHPAFVTRNARRSSRQLWMSRYIVFFQLGRFADRRVAAQDFDYLDRLWRRWAPGFRMPADHAAHVKATFRASMPAPLALYRASGFTVPRTPITVPTLLVTGADDGCALPFLADGQEQLFTAEYRAEVWEQTGHLPHLEDPQRTADTVLAWFAAEEPH